MATTEAEPFALPQVDWVKEVVSEMAVGWVTVMDCVITQPFASVIVTVYVPAESPLALAPVPPEGAHE